MTHRIAHRLRYFEHNPSGPHVTPPIVDHATVTSYQLIQGIVNVSGSTGQTYQLVATAYDAAGNVIPGVAVSWSVDQGGIATVNSSGLVTMLLSGTATVTATVDGRAYPAVVSVTAALGAQDGSLADVRAVIGDANILRWADFTIGSTVTLSGSNITSVADPRGTDYGYPMDGHGTSGPTIGGDGGAVVAQDSDQYMQWPTSTDFNPQRQTDLWIAMVVAVSGINGNPFVSLDDGSTGFGASAQAMGCSCRSDTTPHQFDFNSFHGPTWSNNDNTMWNANRTPVASDTTSYRLVIIEKYRAIQSTQQAVFNEIRAYEVYGAGRTIQFDAGTIEPDWVDQSGVLNWGRESGLNSTGSTCKAILFGSGILTAAMRQALWRYAQRLGAVLHATANAVAAVPTRLVTISHDSNSAGYGCTSIDDAWPVVMQTALGSDYLVKQDGWAGTTAIDHSIWFSRIVAPQINTLAIPKHVHIVGTQVTNDLEAVVTPNSGQRIVAALQSQCAQAKALGAKVLLFTCPRAPSHDETNTPSMLTVNTWCRSAVANGYADTLYDIYTDIGASAGDPHFNTAQNATIAAHVQPLVTALAA